MTFLIYGFPRSVFALIFAMVDYEEVKSLWETGDKAMQHSLSRLTELRMDIDASSSMNGPLLVRHFSVLERLSITSQVSNTREILPSDMTQWPSTIRSLTLGYNNVYHDLTTIPSPHSLASLFPHLEELILLPVLASLAGDLLGSLPESLTRLHLPNVAFADTLIATLPRGITDLRVSINSVPAPNKIIEFPPSLTCLHVPTTGDVRPVYRSLPPTVTDFEEQSQSFGMPPPWDLLPPTLLALKCSLHMLSTPLAASLPKGLLFLHLDFQQAISIETFQALPLKGLRYLVLKPSWDQSAVKAPWSDIYPSIPDTLTHYDIGTLGGDDTLKIRVDNPMEFPMEVKTSDDVLYEGESKYPLGRIQLHTEPIEGAADPSSPPLNYSTVPDRLIHAAVSVNKCTDQSFCKIQASTRFLYSLGNWSDLTSTAINHISNLRKLRILSISSVKDIPLDLEAVTAPLEGLFVHASAKLPSPLPPTLNTLSIMGTQEHSFGVEFMRTLPPRLTSLSVLESSVDSQVLLALPPNLIALNLRIVEGSVEMDHFERLPPTLTQCALKLATPILLSLELCRRLPRRLRDLNVVAVESMLPLQEEELDAIVAALPVRMYSFGSGHPSFYKVSQGLRTRQQNAMSKSGRQVKQ